MTFGRTAGFLISASVLALSGCGGGGGSSGLTSIPTPPPAPTPTPQSQGIIPAATTSQEFSAAGASFSREGDQTQRLEASEQIQVRYVESTDSYEVQIPHSETWAPISLAPDSFPGFPVYMGETATLWLRSSSGGYQYSALFEWSDKDGTIIGHEAIGIPTPAAGIPVTGSASYLGLVLGHTSEVQGFADMQFGGSIELSFDFGQGTLSGSISPILYEDFAAFPLGTISFRDTVYSAGSTSFSGMFDTNVPGLNSFSGLFTGPAAQELIGNFALPYQSPIDSQNYQAHGAFVGRAD